MKTQFLVIFRHAGYDRAETLEFTAYDKNQIISNSRKVMGMVGGALGPGNIRLCASPAEHAQKSAQIIAVEFGLNSLETFPCLLSKPDNIPAGHLQETLSLINGNKAPMLVLVTHCEVSKALPIEVSDKHFNGSLKVVSCVCGGISYHILGYHFPMQGSAWVVDFKKSEASLVGSFVA